jgi:hypothetical protein
VIARTPTLADWPHRMVRLACDLCPRCGQYREETLIARFGGGVLMPDVRHLIAECPRKDALPARSRRTESLISPTFNWRSRCRSQPNNGRRRWGQRDSVNDS